MSAPRSEIETTLVRLFRYWPVVVVSMLVGALAVGGYAYLTAPEPGFAGKASVRVVNLSGNAAAPTAETVAAAAIAPSTRDKALLALGTDAKGAGAVSSEVNVKDKSVVDISAVHADKAAALRYAEAVRSIATSESLAVLSQWLDVEKARLASYQAETARVDAAIADAQAQSEKNPGEGTWFSVLTSLQSQKFSLEQTTRDIALRVAAYESTVSNFGEPTASGASNRREIAVAAAQGALIGLIVGIIFAVIADRARNRKTVSAT